MVRPLKASYWKAFWGMAFFCGVLIFLPICNDIIHAGLFSDFKEAYCAFQEKRYPEALEICNRLLSQNDLQSSIRAKVLAGRGVVHERLGLWSLATKDFEQAARLSPKLAWAYIGQGNVLMAQSKYNEAISEFDRTLSFDSRNTTAIYRRGNCHFLTGSYLKAYEDYNKVLQINSNHRYARIMFHLAGLRCGKSSKVESTDEPFSFDSDWPNPILSFYSEKLKPRELLLKTDDDNKIREREKKSEAYFHIGQQYLLSGNYDKAEQAFSRCISQNIKYYMEHLGAQSELIRLEKNMNSRN